MSYYQRPNAQQSLPRPIGMSVHAVPPPQAPPLQPPSFVPGFAGQNTAPAAVYTGSGAPPSASTYGAGRFPPPPYIAGIPPSSTSQQNKPPQQAPYPPQFPPGSTHQSPYGAHQSLQPQGTDPWEGRASWADNMGINQPNVTIPDGRTRPNPVPFPPPASTNPYNWALAGYTAPNIIDKNSTSMVSQGGELELSRQNTQAPSQAPPPPSNPLPPPPNPFGPIAPPLRKRSALEYRGEAQNYKPSYALVAKSAMPASRSGAPQQGSGYRQV